MNNTTKNNSDVLIKPIVNPNLSDAGYANGIEQMISNINDNFAQLANRDFIKGDMGSSVEIMQVPIFDEESGEIIDEICLKLKDYICSFINIETDQYLNDDPDLDYLGNFKPENAGSLQLIYNRKGDVINYENVPISSLQYVFLDGRFWNTKIGNIDNSLYEGIEDKSCIIVYDKDNGFKSLNNAFPTLYYESGVGFCWKLNGKTTGIPVQGLAGKDGINSLIRIVKVDELTQSEGFELSEGAVTQIFESFSGWIDVNNENIDIESFNESSVIIFNSKDGKIYFGILNVISNDIIDEETNEILETVKVLKAKCDPSVSLNEVISTENVLNIFKNINIVKNIKEPNNLQGLFIPIKSIDSEQQSAHLLSASAIINTGDTVLDVKNDMIFTPVNDIDNLNVSEEHPLQVDKYLYLKIKSDFNPTINNDNLKKYNYCIKYKLIDIINDIDNAIFLPSSNNFDIIKDETGDTAKDVLLTTNNIIYKVGENEYSTDYKDTLKSCFDNNAKLYAWQKCEDRNENYDVDELLNNSEGNYTNIPPQFDIIYTKTFTPGISSEIIWFNGIELCDEEIYSSKYVISGYGNENESPFEFIKFVPVYSDVDYHVYDDTAINFNYNINITGCDHENSNAKRNLTVHGDINCDNINVYKLTATGEIDNIYTKNTIVGDSGLNIGKNEDGDYNFIVEPNGDILNKSKIETYEVISNNSVSSPIMNAFNTADASGRINTNNISILDKSNKEKVNVSVYNSNQEGLNVFDNAIDVKLDDIRSLNINKKSIITNSDHKYTYDKDTNKDIIANIPKISTDLPIIATGKSSIILTNKPVNDVLFDQNVSRQLYDDKNIEKYKDQIIKKPNSYVINREAAVCNAIKASDSSINSNILTNTGTDCNKIDSNNVYTAIYSKNPSKAKTQKFTFNDGNGKIAEFNLTNEDVQNISLDSSSEIKITLPSLKFAIGLYSHCDNGKWTIFKGTSNLKFKYVIQYLKDNIQESEDVITASTVYKFNNSKDIIWTDKFACYSETGGASPSWKKSPGAWRFKAFTVNPLSVSLNSEIIDRISKYYVETGGSVKIEVYPIFEINLDSEGTKKKCADDCKILPMLPVGSSTSQSSNIITDTTYIEKRDYIDNYSKLEYKEIKSVGVENSSETVLCNDGIVIQVNKYVFGLGYSEDGPELYYNSITKEKSNPKVLKLNELFDRLLDDNKTNTTN